MIALCRLRLINWHNFVNDLLNIQQITYLIGVNGVGKTTILDALRYCLTTSKSFNALGNRKSKRTLLGSVHGKQRDQDGDRPRYSRKGHTVSYVGAEFRMIPQPLGRTPLSLRSGWTLRNLTRTCVTYSSAGTSLPGASCWRTSPSWAPTIFPQSGNSSARKMGKCGIPTIKSWQKT